MRPDDRLADGQGNGQYQREAQRLLLPPLSRPLRQLASQQQVSVASHLQAALQRLALALSALPDRTALATSA